MSNLQLALPGLLARLAVEWVWRDDFDEVTDVKRFEHATVMRDEVVRALAPRPGGVYVDATLGGGGHTVALLEAEPRARIVGFDRDPVAIDAAARAPRPGRRPRDARAGAVLARARASSTALGIDRVDGVVADLGVSSPQLDDAERGMSFRREGPIDMRMDRETGRDGARAHRAPLGRRARRRHLRLRRRAPLAAHRPQHQEGARRRRAPDHARPAPRHRPRRRARRASAASTRRRARFQALRIAVNRELDELADAARGAAGDRRRRAASPPSSSFHSLEDRLVKRAFVLAAAGRR